MAITFLIHISIAVAVLAPFSAFAALLLLPAVAAKSQTHWTGNVFSLLMLGWLLWPPASLFFSQMPGLSLPQAAALVCMPLAWLAGSTLHARNQLDGFLMRSLPVLLLVLIVWGLLQGPNTFTLKPQGPFNDPNTYAALLNLLGLPLLARYLAADLVLSPRWLRTGQLALLAAAAFIAFLVSSRGAALALLLVLPALFWLARKQPQFGRKSALLAAVSLVSYFSALSISGGVSVAQRLIDTVQGGDPYRIMLMRSAWLMIQEHPWLGTGLGTFRMLYPQYRYSEETVSASGWVHNDYLQLWLEAGLPMFLLIMGLLLWVAWAGWRTLRQGGSGNSNEALLRIGYLAGIGAILLHAAVNFLFFFTLVSLLLGLYLARVGEVDTDSAPAASIAKGRQKNLRALRMAAGGYAFLLGYLLVGQVAVEGLLGEARSIQRTLWKWQIPYPRYEVAYWISVLAPFHPSPQHIMGLELASVSGGGGPIRDEALARMEAGWQRAPCYLPYANDALAVIREGPLTNAMRARGQAIAERNLGCNARHGLSYYHLGGLAESDSEAMLWWRAGLAADTFLGVRLLLATAILSRTVPGHEQELTALAAQMAEAIRRMEANPGIRNDQVFWREAQYTLWRIAGYQYFALLQTTPTAPFTKPPSQ